MSDDAHLVLPSEAVVVALQTVTEIVGLSGIRTVLRHAGLDTYMQDGKVAEGMEVTFGHIGQVSQALMDIYGPRGAAAMLRHAGSLQFTKWQEAYPGALGVAQIALKALPPMGRVRMVLKAVTVAAKQIVNVESSIDANGDKVVFKAYQCPYCSGVKADHKYCLTAVGALEAVTEWATGNKWSVEETACRAMGNDACVFELNPV